MSLLDKYLPNLLQREYLFAGRLDGHISVRGFQEMIKRLLGPSYSPHSLRSGSITAAMEAGANTEQLLHLSGHKYASSLQRYNQSSIVSNNAVTRLL